MSPSRRAAPDGHASAIHPFRYVRLDLADQLRDMHVQVGLEKLRYLCAQLLETVVEYLAKLEQTAANKPLVLEDAVGTTWQLPLLRQLTIDWVYPPRYSGA